MLKAGDSLQPAAIRRLIRDRDVPARHPLRLPAVFRRPGRWPAAAPCTPHALARPQFIADLYRSLLIYDLDLWRRGNITTEDGDEAPHLAGVRIEMNDHAVV